jgi:diketogulonate reductase-like aldo/keto reductase
MEFKELGNTSIYIPAIGMGTWEIGGTFYPDYSLDKEAINSLRKGLELGMTLIDTAEMYGKGHSEEIVGKAIKGFPRDKIFIVTKVLPENLRFYDLINAAERSLKRLDIDYIDLYLIHAPNLQIPLKETMEAMEKLCDEGIVRFIGVSNFDVDDMEQARKYLAKIDIVVNQVEYSLLSRDVESTILPYCIANKITLMAYCPLGRGVLARDKFLTEIGIKYKKTAAQVALNWLIQKERVIAIPKAIKIKHIIENANSTDWRLNKEDIELIEKHFN